MNVVQGWKRGMAQGGHSARRRGAFTLIEMLVVMVVIVLILAVSLPAFSNMLYSQEETAAESQLQAGVSAARDAAVRLGPGQDTAAVFAFEPGGRLTILTAVKVGHVHAPLTLSLPAGVPSEYEVFAPISGGTTVQLPPNWMVRGYATEGAIDLGWYGPRPGGAKGYSLGKPAWVAPETSFYDHSRADDGANRNTFVLRFSGGSGELTGASMEPILVVLPRPSYAGRPSGATWLRPDLAEDLVVWARRALVDPLTSIAANQRAAFRWALLGRGSGDTVVAKPVQTLALYDESRLARGLGVRLNRISGSLMQVDPADLNNGHTLKPAWVPELAVSGPYSAEPDVAINRWIEGYTNLSNPTDRVRGDTSPARLYSVSRHVGSLQALLVPRSQEVDN